jgi:hypothetical protein
MEMGGLRGSMEQDRTIIETTNPIYWCRCHERAGIVKECPEAIEIGWVTDSGEYIAKGIPNG